MMQFLTRISHLRPSNLARDLRKAHENKGDSANSCHADKRTRLQLFTLSYNLANFLRQLSLSKRAVPHACCANFTNYAAAYFFA